MDNSAPSASSNSSGSEETTPNIAQANGMEDDKGRRAPNSQQVEDIFNQISLAMRAMGSTTTPTTVVEDEKEVEKILEMRLSNKKIIEEISQNIVPTDMIRLQNIPKHYELDCELWVKCEFQHHSGSSKFRTALVMLELLEQSGKIKPSITTLITHSSATFTFALALANLMTKGKYNIVSVLPDRASKIKISLLHHLDVKIFRAPEESSDNRISKESPAIMTEFLTTKIDNSYILDPFQDPLNPETHFWWTGPEILRQFDDKIDMLVCGYETGGMISGISPVVKDRHEDCIVIGADLSGKIGKGDGGSGGQDKCKHRVDTCSIEEFSSPDVSNVMNLAVVDKWYGVPWKEAFCKARELLLMEGIPASPSAGATLHATLQAIKEFGFPADKTKKILMILDNSAMYTDFEYGSNDWMIGNQYYTHEDLESMIWFHKIHTWRIPVKVPVTVFDDFNAYAVYSMMNSEQVNRVVVCDAHTKSIIGIASLPLLNKNIEAGLVTRVTLIGNSYCISRSFQTISIHENISSLLELLKTHCYGILVQRQKIHSGAKPQDQEWLAGILDAEDVIKFLVELEQCHSKNFGPILAGGFQTVNIFKMKNQPVQDKLGGKDFGPNGIFEPNLNTLAKTLAPKFASPIVMNTMVETNEKDLMQKNNDTSNVVPDPLANNHPLDRVEPTQAPSMQAPTIQSTNQSTVPAKPNHYTTVDVDPREYLMSFQEPGESGTDLGNVGEVPINPSAPFSPATSEYFYEPATPTAAPVSSPVYVSALQLSNNESTLSSTGSAVQLVNLEVDSSSIIQIELNSELNSSNDSSDTNLDGDYTALSVSESIFRAMYSSEQVQHGTIGQLNSSMFLSPNASNVLSNASSSNVIGKGSSYFMLPGSLALHRGQVAQLAQFPENDASLTPIPANSTRERSGEEEEENPGHHIPTTEASPSSSESPKVNPTTDVKLKEKVLERSEREALKDSPSPSSNVPESVKISLVPQPSPNSVKAPDKCSESNS